MKKILLLVTIAIFLSMNVLATNCPYGSYWAGNSNPDAYANSVEETTGTVMDPGESLGIDDNSWSLIHPGSEIVLDMGFGEEIWDKVGFDIIVYGDDTPERAKVWVSNDPNSGWELAGNIESDEVEPVGIEGTSYTSVRYVKVENPAQRKSQVELDAVRGLCITDPEYNEIPEFGTFGLLAALMGIGAFVVFRRKI